METARVEGDAYPDVVIMKKNGDQYTEQEQLNDFIARTEKAYGSLGEKVSGVRRETSRLWPYGDRGAGAIGWPGVPSGVSGEPGIRVESVRVAKQYIDSIKLSPARPDGASSPVAGAGSGRVDEGSKSGSVKAEVVPLRFNGRRKLRLSGM
jgi:hypothetical protein